MAGVSYPVWYSFNLYHQCSAEEIIKTLNTDTVIDIIALSLSLSVIVCFHVR